MILVLATGLHLKAPRLRVILRWIHIIGGIFIGTFVYSPWGTEPAFIAVMQFVVMPVLIMTGIAMWQQPRLARLIKPKPDRQPEVQHTSDSQE